MLGDKVGRHSTKLTRDVHDRTPPALKSLLHHSEVGQFKVITKMRNYSRLFGCLLLFGVSTKYSSAQAPSKAREEPSVHSILREASEIALKQGPREAYWTDGVLLAIAEQQIRAGDFDGALRSVRGSRYPEGRNSALVRLAEALARAGKKDRALEVSRLIDTERSRTQDHLQEIVQIKWVEHLIAKGDLPQASKAVEQIKSPQKYHEVLRNLAVAWSKAGDAAQATQYFTKAIEAVKAIKRDFDRVSALWETGDAQRLTGALDNAHTTLKLSIDSADDLPDPRAKAWALSDCAVLAAKLKKKETAQLLFDRAIKSLPAVDASEKLRLVNKLIVVKQIAVSQGSVGFIDDARKTTLTIEPSETDFSRDEFSEGALYAIAVAQLNAGDPDGAVKTALSLKYYGEYRDDALDDFVAHHIGKRDLKAALSTTEKFENPSRKAVAMLRVASAQVRAGDRRAAGDIAARIKLNAGPSGFDYRRPLSWGENCDRLPLFTFGLRLSSERRRAEVAAAAMELVQALEYKPSQSYATLFNDIDLTCVVQSLARAHAKFGDPNETVAWANPLEAATRSPKRLGTR